MERLWRAPPRAAAPVPALMARAPSAPLPAALALRDQAAAGPEKATPPVLGGGTAQARPRNVPSACAPLHGVPACGVHVCLPGEGQCVTCPWFVNALWFQGCYCAAAGARGGRGRHARAGAPAGRLPGLGRLGARRGRPRHGRSAHPVLCRHAGGRGRRPQRRRRRRQRWRHWRQRRVGADLGAQSGRGHGPPGRRRGAPALHLRPRTLLGRHGRWRFVSPAASHGWAPLLRAAQPGLQSGRARTSRGAPWLPAPRLFPVQMRA